jgi:cobaltochelatase CobS
MSPGSNAARCNLFPTRMQTETAPSLSREELRRIDAMADDIVRRLKGSEVPAPKKVASVTLNKRVHYKFPLLLKAVEARVDAIALVGPAGTGKTTAAKMVADALGRKFEATSFGPTTSKADLFGFIDANGVYRDTGLVRAARSGGVFMGDELDAGNSGVVVGTNMVTANAEFAIPTGMVSKHADFVAIFGMNTWGSGATREYVGRNQLDAASLDRQAVIEWDLDMGLEAEMCGVTGIPSPQLNIREGGVMRPEDWLAWVWKVREAISQLKIRHLVTPRASQNGTRLFAVGVGRKHVEEMCLWKGLDAATREKIEAKARAI